MYTRETPDEFYKSKKKERNGLLYALFWHVSLYLVKIFQRLGVSANVVTILGFLLHIGGGLCFLRGDYATNVAGALVLVLAVLLDCTDGKLARATKTTSDLGIWLEFNFDYIRYLFIYPPMLWALFQKTGDARVFLLGYAIMIAIFSFGLISQRFDEFPFAKGGMEDITKSKLHVLAKQFYAYEIVEVVFLLLFVLADKIYLYLIIWSAGMMLYYLGTAFILGRIVDRHDRTEKQHPAA